MINILKAIISDLPKVEVCAREFYESSKFLNGFDLERFCRLWTGLLESDSGVIFAIEENGEWVGAIGGLAYQEIYSGQMTALEMFWFVRPGHRGQGIKLYRALESWAREKQCFEMRMVHLLDSMPEKLERVYRHFNFKPAEIHYTKELH